MENVIVIRYGEIFLKGKNRKIFENLLKDNIQNSLKDIPHKFSVKHTRYIVSNYGNNEDLN